MVQVVPVVVVCGGVCVARVLRVCEREGMWCACVCRLCILSSRDGGTLRDDALGESAYAKPKISSTVIR